MSNVLYPSSLIERQIITPYDRVLKDDFEDGTTQARRIWTAQEYKHRIEVLTTKLTRAEWSRLRSFLNQRGTYDSFWFRDNLDRTGNYEVRLRELQAREFEVAVMQSRITMEDLAPRRHLPELDEVLTASGQVAAALRLWYDPNREFYALEDGAAVLESETWDETYNDHRADWQGGYPLILTGAQTAQYQSYNCSGNEWALCSNYAHGVGTNQPSITLFIIAKATGTAAAGHLLQYGTHTSDDCLGIQLTSGNLFEPYDANGATWGAASQSNATASTWRSFAVTAALASNDVKFYCNAALLGTITRTRTQAATNFSLGAATDSSGQMGDGAGATADLAHAMAFNAALSLAQVKSLHNLFAYQYGMATVA